MIEITQADREAAAEFYGPHLARPGEPLITAHMRDGKVDESPLIQAFAAHRIAETSRLEADNYALAAGACIHPANLVGDERGNPVCMLQAEIAKLRAALAPFARADSISAGHSAMETLMILRYEAPPSSSFALDALANAKEVMGC